jgi:non-heme chloroperoxidase
VENLWQRKKLLVVAPPKFYYTLGYNTIVPSYVRSGLLSRSLTNNDLLPTFKAPVLITHGQLDEIVLLEAAFITC